jgi:hypothetical protein
MLAAYLSSRGGCGDAGRPAPRRVVDGGRAFTKQGDVKHLLTYTSRQATSDQVSANGTSGDAYVSVRECGLVWTTLSTPMGCGRGHGYQQG